MSSQLAKIIIPVGVAALSTLTIFISDKSADLFNFLSEAFNNLFSFKFGELEIKLIYQHLLRLYPNLKEDLSTLSSHLIEHKEFLEILRKKIEALISKNKELQKTLSEPKKIILLGDSGAGKSTLINCLDDTIKANEAKVSAPTTMEYSEYKSSKFKDYIFCDTRGLEPAKLKEINNYNIKKINESIKSCHSYIFWFLKPSTSNFQDSDVNYIKSLENSLKGKPMPMIFIIPRCMDDEEDKKKLEISLREHFPYKKYMPIFPVLARGTKKFTSYGLDELMNETQNFFKKNIILKNAFKEIYKVDEKYQKNFEKFENSSSYKDLLILILNRIRLDEYGKKLDKNEDELIENFYNEKFNNFKNSNFDDIVQLCLLIKAKNEIIDINSSKKITEKLSNINNISEDDQEWNIEKEILEGYSQQEKEKIKLKAKSFYNKGKGEEAKMAIKKIIEIFIISLFKHELINQVKNNLLAINNFLE